MFRLHGSRDRIRLLDADIEYEIVHRPRVTRRIHLDIDSGGGLLVVAPRTLSRRAIRHSLQERAPQVGKYLQQARSRQEETGTLRYADGEGHLYLGESYPLAVRLTPGRNGSVELKDGVIVVCTANDGSDRVRGLLFGWYRASAQSHFSRRLRSIGAEAPWTGGRTPELRLRLMKRTWGNCTADGRITLNTALVKAPPELIDYVISHEICHLREHNHGPGFYRLQQQLYPRWREARGRLKDRGHLYLHR